MASNAAEPDFNTIFFEKKLTNLKDSQESINNCCHWCLENHQHHKKIVSAWLTVLKRVKVEHRLTLFYLANDVIQYSKRRNLHFVESWGTTLQKATTMVRDEKVKHKILRIFKIWEQRGIYGEEFITDLSGLISASPSAKKSEEPHEFQSSYLIPKIRNCAKLEADTDMKLKKFKEHHPKMMDLDALCSSLKDRAHVDDVDKEMEEYVMHIEAYVNALKLEIKSRNNLISLLTQADTQLDNDKKDVKLVANAYKTFASRVKGLKKKLDDIIPTLSSPTPSPDINAPSPSPDSEIDLPVIEAPKTPNTTEITQSIYTNAGFYNPVPPSNTESNASFINNGFSSFMGTTMPFNIQNLNASLFVNSPNQTTPQVTTACQTQTTDVYSTNNSISSLFPSIVQPPPPPAPVPAVAPSTTDYQYGSGQIPLMPPPIPPFNKVDGSYATSSSYSTTYNSESNANYGNTSYDQSSNNYSSNNGNYPPSITNYQQSQPTTTYPQSVTSYQSQEPTTSYPQPVSNYQNPSYETPVSSFQNTTYPPPPPPPVGSSYAAADEYNPEQEPETWENESTWEQPPVDLETPESPPIFEKESYSDPVEYHDNQSIGAGCDIDHRVLSILPTKNNSDSDKTHRKTDVDHRNLISLTGSPKETPVSLWTSQTDQDYRTSRKINSEADQDYRISFNFENLKLPPPPPPPNQSPNKAQKKQVHSPRKILDNVESIDMDLSEDDNDDNIDSDNTQEMVNDNLRVVTLVDNIDENSLEPPPPFPVFSDEADANANNLLDDLNNDLDDPEDLISALGEEAEQCDEMDVLSQMPNFDLAPPWNNRFPPGPGEPNGFLIGPPNFALNAPQYPPPMRNLNWMEPGFNQEFSAFPGRGNKRGNFSTRGDFRGRPRGFVWRGRPNFRANNRGGPPRGGFNRGNVRTRPFFRGRFRGGYQN